MSDAILLVLAILLIPLLLWYLYWAIVQPQRRRLRLRQWMDKRKSAGASAQFMEWRKRVEYHHER